ncbi:MAG: hypothetical protein GY832_34670 [Chloroflexi bacterium]|nr:hypothetical protein [Chloroflexota bacterium]
MITPGITSSLRPVIAAFYETARQMDPGWGLEKCRQTLRRVLASDKLSVETSSFPDLDLIVDERIGVTILPSATQLTDAARHRIRQALSGIGAPRVALIAVFSPHPRLARVDAPRRRSHND